MAVVDSMAEEILRITGTTREELKKDNVEVSELNLMVTATDELALEFEVLGQSFLLTPKGVFTFDELGDVFVPRPEFRKAIESHLQWRLAALRRFSL